MCLGYFTWVVQIPMMAAAMASRNSFSLKFPSLAREQALVERTIATDRLTRLKEVGCELVAAELLISLHFSDSLHFNDRRPMVAMQTTLAVKAACQWCLEDRTIEFQVDASTWLAENETQANSWAQEDLDLGKSGLAIVVANPSRFDEVVWFEDEVLLHWPVPVCTLEICEFRPATAYGNQAHENNARGHEAFTVLNELKERAKS